jgi:hypothetical protein
MVTALFVLAGAAALVALYLALRPRVRAYLTFRGTRVITCPETGAPAAVEVDAQHAARTAAHGEPDLRLTSCSRWPERQGCGQECLKQVEAAPADCLVRVIVTRWYAGKSCALCGKPVGEINWLTHEPALLSPERRTIEWGEVSPEQLPAVLATHRPVCWGCHLAEAFRQEHPELVVQRPWPGPEAPGVTAPAPPEGLRRRRHERERSV